ncbi:MAG: hypothetical protein GY705_25120 [Bacteroidetes bacterium]|nr:hypothetical protein [Bacteroidota bacterium]
MKKTSSKFQKFFAFSTIIIFLSVNISWAGNGFFVTKGTYSERVSNDQACNNEYGNQMRIADWNDVKAYYNSHNSMDSFFTTVAMPPAGSANQRNLRVSLNGSEMYSSSRHYFISRHDHNKPGYYLAHSNIDNYLISLGSWYGSMNVLCYGQKYTPPVPTPLGKVSLIAPVNLLLGPSFLLAFNGSGPSNDGGLLTTNTRAKSDFVSTNQYGIAVIENEQLNSKVKITILDPSGNVVQGLKIQSRALDGNLSFIITDPLGRYASTIYRGNPLQDAYEGLNPNIYIEENRVFFTTVAVLVTVGFIAYAEINYILNAYEMDVFHISNIASTIDKAGIFRCTPNELINYLKANYNRKMAAVSMITSYVLAGAGGAIGGSAGVGLKASERIGAVLSIGLDVGSFLNFEFLQSLLEQNAENAHGKTINEMYGTFNGDTPIWVRINNLEDVGDFFPQVEVDIMPIDFDDNFEENDSLSNSINLTSTTTNGLVVYENDPDYYQLNLNQGDAWWAKASFMNSRGNVDLQLHSPTGEIIKSSNGTGSSESITIDSAPAWGKYVLKVYNSGGEWDANMYNLEVSDLGGNTTPSETMSFRVVLNWGNSPLDLDSHLWTPSINGSIYHVYYPTNNRMNPNEHPFVGLDVDDTDGFGPETITINEIFSGNYNYSVHNFSGGNISGSNASVEIYGENGLLRKLTVPTTGSGEWWDVFQINGSTGAIQINNTIRDNSPRLSGKLSTK